MSQSFRPEIYPTAPIFFTLQDEIAAMQFMVQMMFEHHLINEAERKKIIDEYGKN